MHFGLTPEQTALQNRARELAQGPIAGRAAEVDVSESYPWDNVTLMKEAGFLGMTIPAQWGGAGLNYLDAVLVIEQLAAACLVGQLEHGRDFRSARHDLLSRGQ